MPGIYLGRQGETPPLPEGKMKTPLEMKNEALETKTTVWQDGLTVSPEGCFFLCGRRLTLNEAIMYSGNRRWFERG